MIGIKIICLLYAARAIQFGLHKTVFLLHPKVTFSSFLIDFHWFIFLLEALRRLDDDGDDIDMVCLYNYVGIWEGYVMGELY